MTCIQELFKIRYIQPERPISFKPVTRFQANDTKLSDNTTYKMSYYGHDPNVVRHCRGSPKIAKENLKSAGDFSSDTTHKCFSGGIDAVVKNISPSKITELMSYGAWPGYKPPIQVKPTDHKLMGDGPLSHITTHKHDYTAKPLQEVEKVVHPGNLGFSPAAMEDNTTHKMSYQLPDPNRFEKPRSFKPHSSFNPPSTKMDDKTTHKLSYQPFCPPEKEDYPWAKKDMYRAPAVPFDGSTIYNGSYFAPGQFVEEADGPSVCCCSYPKECYESCGGPPKAHEFDMCPCDFDPCNPPANISKNPESARSGEHRLNMEC